MNMKYKVIITPTAFKEINKIYDYILEELYAEKVAKDLMRKVEKSIQSLKHSPKLYAEIDKSDELKNEFKAIFLWQFFIYNIKI